MGTTVRLVVVLLLFFVDNGEGYNILGVFTFPAKSHQMFFRAVWEELAHRGHNVTVMTAVPLKDPSIKNLKEIDISYIFQMAEEQKLFEKDEVPSNGLILWKGITTMLQNLTEEILKRPETNAFLNDSSLNFDVVLAEFVPPAFFYLSEKFKCPLIQMTSMPAHIITLNNIGNPNHLLETVDGNLPFGRKLNVFEKVVNAVYTFLFNAQVQGILYPLQAELVKKYLSHGEDVDLAALEKDKTSLVISNVVPGITEVHAKVPALIEVNGLHLTPPKPLPEDIKEFLDKASGGAIYFSLGSSIKINSASKSTFRQFGEVFNELPYHIIWKHDDDSLTVNTSKVLLRRWFSSQQDILRHPNVKLFITQGGLQSIEEAVAYKVPMIGFPMFGDQKGNVKKLVESGMGLEMEFESATKDDIKKAVVEMMTNQRYIDNVKRISEIAYDRPMSSMEEAIWWIEYVSRHKGASLLRSPYLDIDLNEYYLIDVACAFVLVILPVLYLFIKVNRFLFSKIFRIRYAVKPKTE